MLNLWRFLSKYNSFILFLFYFIISFYLLVQNNDFQRSSTFNSSNQVIGSIYEKVNALDKFLTLNEVNDSLVNENVSLRNQLKSNLLNDSIISKKVIDTLNKVKYEYDGAYLFRYKINTIV